MFSNMQTNVLIFLIVAVTVVILVTLFLNRGRLKRLGIKAGNKGFEVDAEMTDDKAQTEVRSTKKRIEAEHIIQKGNRDKIKIKGDKVKAKDIEQKGDDNSIDIG